MWSGGQIRPETHARLCANPAVSPIIYSGPRRGMMRPYVGLGVGVCVGNDVGEAAGVGVTRRPDTRAPAMLNAILRTTSRLITQATMRVRRSVEPLTTPPHL